VPAARSPAVAARLGVPARFGALALLGACCGLACATTRTVRPLGQGNAAYGASLGGPLVQALGVDLAAPILTVGGGYGLRDDLDLFGNLDLTAAVYGDLHLEPGVAYHPVVREAGLVPTLTVAGSAHLITNFVDARVYPQLTLAGAWRIRRRHLVYVGVDSALGFGATTRAMVGPLVGGELRLGRVGLTLEAKWLAPYYDVAPTAPTWISPADHGYLDLLVGVTYYPGSTS
jgi:hypothetical protein